MGGILNPYSFRGSLRHLTEIIEVGAANGYYNLGQANRAEAVRILRMVESLRTRGGYSPGRPGRRISSYCATVDCSRCLTMWIGRPG